jgi:hypothetical protein
VNQLTGAHGDVGDCAMTVAETPGGRGLCHFGLVDWIFAHGTMRIAPSAQRPDARCWHQPSGLLPAPDERLGHSRWLWNEYDPLVRDPGLMSYGPETYPKEMFRRP